MEKKSLLNYEMAIELLKKALGTVIARTDAQKLADAIAADPTIADIVDIPFEKVCLKNAKWKNFKKFFVKLIYLIPNLSRNFLFIKSAKHLD